MGRRKSLTSRREDVLQYLRDYIREHGRAPTYREISLHFGLSLAPIYNHVRALRELGYLTTSSGARGIRLVGTDLRTSVESALSALSAGEIHAAMLILKEAL